MLFRSISYAKKYAILKLFEIETGEDEESRLHEPESMPETVLADYLAAIDGAAALEDLQKQFTAAYKAAEASQDKAAMASIIKRKDDRKKALAKK